jgi:hypothetical protein
MQYMTAAKALTDVYDDLILSTETSVYVDNPTHRS